VELPATKLDPVAADQTVPFSKISVPPRLPSAYHEAHASEPAKLSAHAAAGAHVKEPAFDDLDEEFFAREAELNKVGPVETFDDLDSGPKRKLGPRKRWFLFGAKGAPQSPPPPPRSKKR
jgi:hypothetical protein